MKQAKGYVVLQYLQIQDVGVDVAKKKRRCKICGASLSMYNAKDICFCHEHEPEYIDPDKLFAPTVQRGDCGLITEMHVMSGLG